MNAFVKKILLDKVKEVPLKNLISTLNSSKNTASESDEQSAAKLSDREAKVDYLNTKAINYSTGWNTLNVFVCGQAGEKDRKHIHIHPSTGDFHCLKCNKSGDWSGFKSLVQEIANKKIVCVNNSALPSTTSNKITRDFLAWTSGKSIKSLTASEFKIMLKNTGLNCEFDQTLFQMYDIRVDPENRALFPVYADRHTKKLLDIVQINTPRLEENLNKDFIYGQDLLELNSSAKEIFITDKLINMLAINQAMKKNIAIVINSVASIDLKLISILERFDKITIWQKDMKLAHTLATALNSNRCFLISYARSPFECLLVKESIPKIVAKETFPIKNDFIVRFEDLKSTIYSEVTCAKKITGIQWKRFTPLNAILKGHRSGEVTIFTGPTGSGKTTFLSEYSLDLAVQGVKTLWGSFELQNHRLVKMMMSQYSNMNLAKNVHLFEPLSDQFKNLPLYFMSFHGEETLENVIRTMSNSVVRHDVKHVIIDNLQFMVGCQFLSMDKFAHQDQIISAFRRFATNFDVHVTIVIHPRKEESDELLKISSIFGTAKATQEADNILILQQHQLDDGKKPSYVKFVQVVKNRFDGELGNMVIKFDKETLTFQTTASQKDRLRQKELSAAAAAIAQEIESDLANTNAYEEADETRSQAVKV